MRINLLALALLVSFSQCNPETKTEEKGNKETKEDSTEAVNDEKNHLPKLLDGNSFSYPFITEYNAEASGKIEFDFEGPPHLSTATIVYRDNSEEVLFLEDLEALTPEISPLAFSNNYHQQLSVYLFEKQWHSTIVKSKSHTNKLISYYEVVNPPRGEFWYLNAIHSENGKSNIVASYRFKLPYELFGKYFEKVNNRKFADFKDVLFNAPVPQKIDYNSLRKMGRFNEGFAASLNKLEFDYEDILSGSIFALKKSPKKISEFYDVDFEFPEMTENGYDTTRFTKHSLKELFASQTFTYKTTYSLTGGTDSLLEMQIDFATKENTPTVRFVMGGIVFSEIPRLKNNEMSSGLYLPIGFSRYRNPEIVQEAYVLMGNTTGFWVDNGFGRNIDGVRIYFDKNSPYKVHIWLVGGDGTIPVGHYVTSLDQLMGK